MTRQIVETLRLGVNVESFLENFFFNNTINVLGKQDPGYSRSFKDRHILRG